MGKIALIVIDVQYDFLPGGALEVKDGDAIIPLVNKLIESKKFDEIVYTQDWHPKGHCSFASSFPGKKPLDQVTLEDGLQQTLWPDHCVQGSHGAELHPDLKRSSTDIMIVKGTNQKVDSYSAFADNNKTSKTPLEGILHEKNVTTTYLVGLAYDYCVSYSALDSKQAGFETFVIEDATRFIAPETAKAQTEKMLAAGIHVIQSTDLL